jgi:peptidoglycan hydrolase-like protein with peptidoglycan-binding domain
MYYALSFLSLFFVVYTESPTGPTKELSKEDVKFLQSVLKELGLDPGPVDGILGPKTSKALREFQKKRELPATGRPDEKTVRALQEEVEELGPPASPANLRVVEIGP